MPLADFLARLGHEPVRRSGNELWYLAPYRGERTSSFRVNVAKQLWYDYGLGKGLIQGTSQYIAKKMRTVKVHLKAGYRVMLYQEKY